MQVEKFEFLNVNKSYRIAILDEMEYFDFDGSNSFHDFYVRFMVMNISEEVIGELKPMHEEFDLHVYLKDHSVLIGYESHRNLISLDHITHVTNEIETIARKMLSQNSFISCVQDELEKVRQALEWEEDQEEAFCLKSGVKYFEEMLDIIKNKPEQVKVSPEFKKKYTKDRLEYIF
ncbi:TPA: hypothetical protein ACG05V_005418 [Bacillus pacificus]|uniref:hypothetical protein n=1 Tax=Bacillus TaxID=1386 RepID=UPI00027CCB98|nr:hypothetical protein BCK_27518 [Bacillus cereus FRI-35]